MKRMITLALLTAFSDAACIRTFDDLTFCSFEVVDLNGSDRDKSLQKYLEAATPFVALTPTSTALECLITKPKVPFQEHVKLMLEISNSPKVNNYTSILVTLKLVGDSTGISYYVRSGHLVATGESITIRQAFQELSVSLISPLKNRISP